MEYILYGAIAAIMGTVLFLTFKAIGRGMDARGELKKQHPNILRGFITLQQDLPTSKKNVYENSPWMVKNYPMEELFLLPNIIKSLEGHVWSAFYRDVTKQNVELAHKHGLSTCVWTVNREQDIIRMIEYGVDGIITAKDINNKVII